MKGKSYIYILFLALVLSLGVSQPVQAKTYKTYKVSASTKPCDKKYQKKAKKDKAAKTTYMLRSYLEKLEKAGGGTLVFKKGTYKIYENLYVPSNVTIKFEKGVKLVAQKRSSLTAMFVPLPPSKTGKANYAKGYKSAKNIKFEGGENVTIDLGNSNASAFYLAHNNKITITGINFKKNNAKRYIIELMGSSNVTISNCSFTGKSKVENAIAVDIPAKKKKRTRKWCKMDDTVNKNITITGCTFDNLNRAIATLRYVGKKYHSGFQITNNTITNIKDDAIRAINWSNCVMTQNTIKTVGTGGTYKGATKSLKRGIYLAGVKNPQITGNTFEDLPRAIEFNVYKNTDAELKSYAATQNQFTGAQLQEMLDNNTVNNIREYTIRVYSGDEANSSERFFFKDDTTTYVIKPDDIPYRNEYTQYPGYNNNTRQYYVFRAVMDQIERTGKPATIVVKAGTYKITNEFPVANNVTIQLEDGVVLQKYDKTGTSSLSSNTGIFSFVEPKHYNSQKVVYSGYNGVHDVQILGPENGTAVIDNNYYLNGICLVMAHCKNVEIKNITFKNNNSAHFIEMDAAQNVTIAGCTFTGHKDSELNNKEAINLDTPDVATGGFIRDWTSYDKTPNDNIFIRNNLFVDVETGVGTHSYSENKPHTNVHIENNVFKNCDDFAIRAMNWNDAVIRNNQIISCAVNQAEPYAVRISGVSNATITGNTFQDLKRPAYIHVGKMTGRGTAADSYAPVYNYFSAQNKTDLLTTNHFVNVEDKRALVYDNIYFQNPQYWTFN